MDSTCHNNGLRQTGGVEGIAKIDLGLITRELMEGLPCIVSATSSLTVALLRHICIHFLCCYTETWEFSFGSFNANPDRWIYIRYWFSFKATVGGMALRSKPGYIRAVATIAKPSTGSMINAFVCNEVFLSVEMKCKICSIWHLCHKPKYKKQNKFIVVQHGIC